MTTATIIAGDLTASLADRVVSGLLLPFGEVGSTNLGKFSIDGPGIIEIPRDVSVLMANEDHSQTEPRGRFLTATETPAGIVASFHIGENPEGDELLARVEAGKRSSKPVALSVEVKNVVLRAGKAIAGKLTGAAFVDRGAFPSATLLAAAVDTPPDAGATDTSAGPMTTTETHVDEFVDEAGVKHKRTTTRTTTVDGDTTTIKETTVIEDPQDTENTDQNQENPVGNATAPNTLTASKAGGKKSDQLSKREVFDILHAIRAGRADSTMLARLESNSGPAESTLFAALADITYDDANGVGVNMGVPQWIGELYSEVTYQRQIADLFNHADLTSLKINGFEWVTKPKGGTWDGNKANIPSNPAKTRPVSADAQRFAGGNDIAIEHRHFNTPGFFESYYAAMAESYDEWVDEEIVLADILDGATTIEADNPAGLAIGAGLSALIDGAAEVITAKAVPTFALVSTDLWKQIAKTPQSATLGYLSAALNLKDGQLDGFVIRPSSLIAAGNVLVGSRAAATVYELPGVPIRVEAPDMIKGGIDTGVFGYAGTVINKPTALQLVTPYTA